jgi:AsmA family
VKLPRSRRAVAVVAVLLLALFLFRPAVYHLRNRIANTIGSALGRRVAIDNVRLRLLPRPGFDLEGLVIYDDPVFSEEPMIRAQEVSAAIRLRSLLRGRLEIATLSAAEPSINLVRNNQGRWNLASLVERSARIPAAPTGKSARHPAFPYLEASHARVNFKIGQTKKAYSLMDADVALWQDSENSWSARIKAEPVRTDFNLTDTGLIQINATWQRSQNLRLTPVQIAVQWQKGQLGQITKLISGRDRGWRGGVNFTANLSGTPEALRIESQTAIDDFHRYDIVERENVRLATACSGRYRVSTNALSDLLCESPVNGGMLRLRGGLTLATQMPAYDLTLSAENVPLTSVVPLLRQAKKQLPSDLTASGLLNAEFHTTQDLPDFGDARSDLLSQWTGTGAATNVRLSSNSGKDEVVFSTIPLVLLSADARDDKDKPAPARTQARTQSRTREPKEQEPAATHLRIGPVPMSVNRAAPVDAGGWISTAGYRFFLRGDVELKDLFHLENVLALPVARPTADGEAKLDVSLSGLWQGFAAPAAIGTAQLRNVRASMRGLNTPIEISSASMTLAPDEVRMQKISARTGMTHWTGSVTAPRQCSSPNVGSGAVSDCGFQFDVAADQLSTADIAEWFTPHPAKHPWYSSSNDEAGPSPLLAVQAHGSLRVGRFELKKLIATQIASHVELDRGKIALTALRAQLLEGTHEGNWTIDASNHDASASTDSAHDASTPGVRYYGAGTLNDISLAQVGTLMDDDWIAGKADGNFELDGSADNFRELLARSDGKLHFVMRNGSLQHVEIPGSPAPLPVHRFAGDLHLKKGTWELSACKLESRDGIYQVSGTASPGGGFDFILTRGDEQSWTLTGTLAKPHIVPGSRTVAKRTEADANTKPVKP